MQQLEDRIAAKPDNPCRAAIRRVFPDELWRQAFVVQYEENHAGSPTAKNPNKSKSGRVVSTDWGCLQINDYYHFHNGHWDGRPASSFEDIFDPEFNVELAKDIYDGAGWQRWYGAQNIYWRKK